MRTSVDLGLSHLRVLNRRLQRNVFRVGLAMLRIVRSPSSINVEANMLDARTAARLIPSLDSTFSPRHPCIYLQSTRFHICISFSIRVSLPYVVVHVNHMLHLHTEISLYCIFSKLTALITRSHSWGAPYV